VKILISSDSFRGSLSSAQVGKHLSTGLGRIFPQAVIMNIPLADGGEGTVDACVLATGGKFIDVDVHDPLMRKISARFGITGDGTTAVIEMAAASGVELLKPNEKNPWLTTTYGTGDLIKAALDHGCSRILIGIGGSATTDGGVGMADSLGVKFRDSSGNIISGEGGKLGLISSIDTSSLDPRIFSTEIIVACDVTNILTGPEGAAYVFSPQKGADPEMVERLDKNLEHLAEIIGRELSVNVKDLPGGGAAGGLGAGLVAFLNARLEKGFSIISQVINLEDSVAKCDLVVTGEGKIDYQTQFGKTAFGISQLAKKYNIPVIAVAGTIDDKADVLYTKGIDAMISIIDKPLSLEEACKITPELLEKTGERIGRLLKIGKIVC
jgi:glycerate 2-kinase